jgi:RNA polymerase sigma-70 factor (ECF subfamily)
MEQERARRFTDLYTQTQSRIVAYVLRRTRSREDAADLVAETYATAWRRIDDVPTGQQGLLWLYVTARQLLANKGRKMRHESELIERLALVLSEIRFAEQPLDEEGLTAVFCLSSLPEAQREILMLAAWEGLGAVELGQVLGCSPVAARLRLHRARLRLKTDLSELNGVESFEPRPNARPVECLSKEA